MPLTEIAALDGLLRAHAAQLGDDFTAYRNHTYRVVNLCAALSSKDPEQVEKMATAAAFHDLGIWTDGTFDYLRPSIRLASAHLARSGRAEWEPEITAMILEHHKISAWRGNPDWLVEPFRRADWVDVTRGLRRFGLPRRLLGEIFSAWPSAGFHKRLVQLELKRLRTHPWNPLPMVRL
ncbi:MAG TPA: HD domain-containing protein [Thermoanaerobaculia bacterium]